MARTAQRLRTLADQLEGLDAVDPVMVDANAAADAMVAVAQVAEALTATRLTLQDVYERSAGEVDRSLSSAVLLQHEARLRVSRVRAERQVFRLLGDRFPRMWRAWHDGAVGADHCRKLHQAASVAARVDALAAAEDVIVAFAREHDATIFGRFLQTLCHQLDPEVFVDADERARDTRYVFLSPLDGAMWDLRGRLDAETGEALMQALQALMGKPTADDDRSTAQRRHDVLADLVEAGLASGKLPDHGGLRPQLTVTVSLETLEDRAGYRLDEQGPTDADPVLATLGRFEWSQLPITPARVRQLACDAQISRVLTDADSVPLDAGRPSRAIPVELRRLVKHRDRSCVIPGCGHPARWCDIHHVIAWEDGGRHALGNLALLCRHHHTLTHKGYWRVWIDQHTHMVRTQITDKHPQARLYRSRRQARGSPHEPDAAAA